MPTEPNRQENYDAVEAVARLKDAHQGILEQTQKVIVGQEDVLEELLTAMFARGHCLLVGVPGLAKTLMVRTLAQTLHMQFNRIQFTPDLMPSDITGMEMIQEDRETGRRAMTFCQGPLFANLILADEVNRTPPRTQAAMLEAMQERQVTVGGERLTLPDPFFVLATQNPIEQEGTYPLPEAQLDRFMFQIKVDYPGEADELAMVLRTTIGASPDLEPVLDKAAFIELQNIVPMIPAPETTAARAVSLARMSRPDADSAPEFVREYVRWGAGPRASQYLILGAKSRAALQGRYCATDEDVDAVASAVLRHRILLNFNAQAESVEPDDVVKKLIEHVNKQADRHSLSRRLPEAFRKTSSDDQSKSSVTDLSDDKNDSNDAMNERRES
jgi:MoxR-like ATPase